MVEQARTTGLIPARAGSTDRGGAKLDAVRAHPRSRGEHDEELFEELDDLGSSPLARGAHQTFQRIGRFRGLIPARAGSTLP